MPAGVHSDAIPCHGDDALDEGVAGRFLHPGQGTEEREIYQKAAAGTGLVVTAQGRIKSVGCMEHNDLAPAGRPLPVGELLDQQPVLQLQTRQHRARGDVTGLNEELADAQGHRHRQQQAAPEATPVLLLATPTATRRGWLFDHGGGIPEGSD